jgi:lysophospholipase L1-like esterase
MFIAKGAPVSAANLTPKLLFNGDSIPYAVRPGVTYEQSAAKRIADARGLTLVNTAVPGHTTTQMLSHWATDLAAHSPAAAAIMMSANDSFNGVSWQQGRQNMIDMINMAQQSGASVTIFSHPLFFHDGGLYNHGVGKQVYAFMQELGGMPGVQFVNVFDYFLNYLFHKGYNGEQPSLQNPKIRPLYAPDANGQPDWLHPSAVGQNLIVEPTLMNPLACAPAPAA